ncbi:hypothetical protein PGTUg99_028393 [Puccinia graminis f. sp. tritici]|uniref:SWIM-type domain-containing protein n=1 Tax=Puccinia graminis f. sp. tritici TaxID=56615 RepID=A0A5B0SF04_PUCGR|nr:hypothetical protein PGTUg99_028393 [Puccinia graminis f. sp. tritici]
MPSLPILQTINLSYPLVNIYDVLPPPFTQEIPPLVGTRSPPNALRLVRQVDGMLPSFPTNPHQFTIPGNTSADAKEFVRAMGATVRWTLRRGTDNTTKLEKGIQGSGRRPEFYFKLEYKCPRTGHLQREINSRKHHPSRKCGCLAKFTVTHDIASNSLQVVWFWEHNHNPYSYEDMQRCRTPESVDKWLNDCVVSGLGWEAIQRLIRLPDLFALDRSQYVSEGREISYDRVRYLIRKRASVLARRDPNVFNSLSIWNEQLLLDRWSTYTPVLSDLSEFIFAFQSPWQKEMLVQYGQSMIMLDSTHNSVSNYFMSDGKKIYLYTFLIWDPITGRGLPIAWAFTASAAEQPLAKVLQWLRTSTGAIPQAFMSDCALAIAGAIKSAYGQVGEQAPKHYWCLFHVFKAFKEQATKHLDDLAESAMFDFRDVAYSTTHPGLKLAALLTKWEKVNPLFAKYIKTQWEKNLLHWATFFRQTSHQGIHTNNYTEAWHRVLKSKYISKDRRRIDEVIQLFADNVVTDYRFNNEQVDMGFAPQTTNKFQQKSKTLADSYTKESLSTLGVKQFQHDTHFFTSSFTNPHRKAYTVKFEAGRPGHVPRLRSCNCDHFKQCGSACKHMYYLAREHRMLVIEQVFDLTSLDTLPSETNSPQTSGPEQTCLEIVDDDSDVEVISVQTAPKRKNVTAAHSPPETNLSKRPRVELPRFDSLPTDSNHSNPSTTLTTHRFDERSPVDPNPVTTDYDSLSARSQSSGLNALKYVIGVMKTAKNRKDFARVSSVASMIRFRDEGNFIRRIVEERCAGVRLTPLPDSSGLSDINGLNREAFEVLMESWQTMGWQAIKRAHSLLGQKQHRVKFEEKSTEMEMEEWKQRCWGVKGIVEDNSPSVKASVQVR